ncbi:MAG TPA: MFS transporter [Acidobacteriaceae bacterium]|jgi:MFS family permease|nr:MFS transporter [Acidobacteriaceae bacterium]
MLDWYRDLERTGRRTFLACFAGWTLDAFDAQMYSLVIPALLATWHISKAAAGSVAGASLAASALGGWFAGVLADRYGRVRMLQVTIAWFAVFSLGSALTHNVRQLILMRALQGFGFGGEWTVGTVLLAEAVPAALRGRALGTLQSGWAVGWGAAVVCSMAAFLCLPQHLAWRVLFAVGFLPALLLLYIQTSLQDQHHARPETPGPRLRISSLMDIFAPTMLRTTLLAALLGLGAHGGYYALTVWLPTWLMQNRHLSVSHMSAWLGILIVFFGFGCLTASWLLDLLGRRRTIVIFSLCCAAMVVAYLILPVGNLAMFCLGAPLGFFSAGIPASMGALFSELFPSGMRGTGVGFCYNFGRVASAGVPVLVGSLSTVIPLNLAIGLTAATAYLLVTLAVLCLPETHRQVLQT